MKNDLLCRFFRGQFAGVDGDFGVGRNFVRIRDAGELFQNSSARLGVQTFAVTLFANFYGGGDVHQNEPSVGLNQLPHILAGRVIRRDGRANCDAAVLGDFRCNVADAPDVDVAVLFGKSEFGRKILAN